MNQEESQSLQKDPLQLGAALEARGLDTFRGGPSFPLKHRMLRAGWFLAWMLLARWTPPQLRRWRILLINIFGGCVHPTCNIYSSVNIWYPPNLEMKPHSSLGPGVECYCMAPITIGDFSVISQRATLCTGAHDINSSNFQIFSKPIVIGPNVWVAAEAFVGPGVSLAKGVVLGARAVTFKSIDPWMVAVGNPAMVIKKRAEF